MSQELVKLAKDNGSSDNISIVVVFLKPIEELAAMELPIDTKDLDTISQNGTNNMMNNNEKEALYDGITSTSIYVGKNSIEVRLFQTICSTANNFESGPMPTPWKFLEMRLLLPNCKLG